MQLKMHIAHSITSIAKYGAIAAVAADDDGASATRCTCAALQLYSQIDVNNTYRFMIMALSEYLFVIIMHHRIIYYCMFGSYEMVEHFNDSNIEFMHAHCMCECMHIAHAVSSEMGIQCNGKYCQAINATAEARERTGSDMKRDREIMRT